MNEAGLARGQSILFSYSFKTPTNRGAYFFKVNMNGVMLNEFGIYINMSAGMMPFINYYM